MTFTLDSPEGPTLVFWEMGNNSQPGHITDTKCRPHITAALKDHWKGDVVPWPFIRFAGEVASKGKDPCKQLIQAISCLHYLLLARLDLHVAQGLLSSDKTVTFLFGIGGKGIWQFNVEWDD